MFHEIFCYYCNTRNLHNTVKAHASHVEGKREMLVLLNAPMPNRRLVKAAKRKRKKEKTRGVKEN